MGTKQRVYDVRTKAAGFNPSKESPSSTALMVAELACVIDMLSSEVDKLRRSLSFCVGSLECGNMHHAKNEYHSAVAPCPVMDSLNKLVERTDD